MLTLHKAFLTTYLNKNNNLDRILGNLKDKIRNDLNEWIKDYFNDYYAYHGPQHLADDRYQ